MLNYFCNFHGKSNVHEFYNIDVKKISFDENVKHFDDMMCCYIVRLSCEVKTSQI